MAVSCHSGALRLPFWLQTRTIRLKAHILACFAVEVEATSSLLGSLLLEQFLGCLHLGLVPHRLGPALNVVVIRIVLFLELSLGALSLESRAADRSLELLVHLGSTKLARYWMLVEAAVRPGAGLRYWKLRGSWVAGVAVGSQARQSRKTTTLPGLVVGLWVDLANVLEVLFELKLRLVESLREGVRLLLQVVEAVGPLRLP